MNQVGFHIYVLVLVGLLCILAVWITVERRKRKMSMSVPEGDTTRRLQIGKEGAAARQAGQDRSDNPYASPSFREYWNSGFDNPELYVNTQEG